MRIAIASLVASLAACSKASPPPAAPPSQQVVRAPVSAVPTCADMGPLLRGHMDDEEREGANKEAVIVAACERDKWPAPVLECVASSAEPVTKDCLARLSDEQLAGYEKAIESFASADADADIPVDDDVSCERALAATALDAWPPMVSVDGERSLATKLRGHALLRRCEDQHWDLAVRQCIETSPVSEIEECRVALGAARHVDIDDVIDEADKQREKIVKVLSKPAALTCEKVVATHYGPAKWKGKAPELKGAARTKAIDTSKKSMLGACKSTWTAEAKACVIAIDSDVCSAFGVSHVTWTFPSKGSSAVQTGIAECDDYAAAVYTLAACDSIPEATRKTLVESFEQVAPVWKNMVGPEREAARSACKAAADATRQAAAACT